MIRASSVLRCVGTFLAILASLVITDAIAQQALARNVFGGPSSPVEPPIGGIVGWLIARQSEFYQELSSTIRSAKSDGSAVWTLLAVSFAYGIFHAAGPGHGKAVIASYLVANQETARRGIVLSFASALMQAQVAVAIVAVFAWALSATAKTMCNAEKIVEIVSYALIAAFGARLVWVKGGAFVRALRAVPPTRAMALAVHQHHHRRGHDQHQHHGHGYAQAQDDDSHCGHSHGPEPSELAGPQGWRHGFAAIFTVGVRPCSGAILVLVFTLAQGILWAGVVATFVMGLGTAITVAAIAVISVTARDVAKRLSAARDGAGALFMRGIEFGAAGLVLLLGTGLLFGYVLAERVTCL